jgi:transmembrane sensor
MSLGNLQEKTEARRLVEATAWRTHLSEHDLESTPDFELWLTDTRNREAWQSVQHSWNFIGEQATAPELLDLRRQALARVHAAGRERWQGGQGKRRFLAAIAASLLLAVTGGVVFYMTAPDVYRTQAGERRVVTLADGSQVQLDSQTELRVDYSKHSRDLKLVRGQARFDVARDVERPFSVVAADKKVVATGTAFNVDLLGKDLFVTLIEGKVVILPQAAPASRPPAVVSSSQHADAIANVTAAMPRLAAIELAAGQQLSVLENGSATVAATSVDRATAWQSGQIVVENEPLGSVARRVGRYSERPIRLLDEQLAALKISGVFVTGDVDGFVQTITHFLPVQAEVRQDAIYLRRRGE